MITSTQITNTEICAVIAVVVFKLLSREILFITKQTNKQTNKKTQEKLLKIANFTGKLLQNYK